MQKDNEQPQPGLHTPDGIVQKVSTIAPGVFWVDTGSHGFLVLSYVRAKKLLSPQACKIGMLQAPWLFFEEDCAIAAPLYEYPEWQSWSGFTSDSYNPETALRNYFPAYFQVPRQLALPFDNYQ